MNGIKSVRFTGGIQPVLAYVSAIVVLEGGVQIVLNGLKLIKRVGDGKLIVVSDKSYAKSACPGCHSRYDRAFAFCPHCGRRSDPNIVPSRGIEQIHPADHDSRLAWEEAIVREYLTWKDGSHAQRAATVG